MNYDNLVKYYNKFNEDKRLDRRHGQVEFITSMKYISYYLQKMSNPKILDVGAGTGKYSITLHNLGYDVTAVELIKHNLMTLKSKNKEIKAYQGTAIDLHKFKNKSFNLILLFGPLYHLISEDDKIKALKEAKRLLTDDGIIMVSYYMNDYCVITHGFKENNIKESLSNLTSDFHIISKPTDLYSMVRIEDINKYNKLANLERIKIVAQDGPSDYIRNDINKLDAESFDLYVKYHLATCERKDLIGASSHTLDILKK